MTDATVTNLNQKRPTRKQRDDLRRAIQTQAPELFAVIYGNTNKEN